MGAEVYADAAKSLTKALDRATGDRQKFDALYRRALAYNGADETDQAIADLRELLVLNVADREDDQAAAAELLADLDGPEAGPTHTSTPSVTVTP